MEITVLGAAREVGRSAFLVSGKETKVLLDYGAMTLREPAFPMHVQPKDVDGIILSHAHLDHCGATPVFYLRDGMNLYTTALSAEIAQLLIEDFLKISGFYLPFEFIDLLSMMKKVKHVSYREDFKVAEFTARFLEAGHIPGGASVMLENDGRRLMYTGDINANDTTLIRGAQLDFGEVDAVITESTYALTDHPKREAVEAEFIQFAHEVVERGGTLLVPAFSVGRAQEIACVLRAHGFPHPVAMDGMALKTNEILFRYLEYLKDPKLFRDAIENLEIISGWSQRKKVVKTPSVIISPAGMLVGGAAIFYNSEVAKNTRNAISLVSYQAQGTPGRTLLDRGLALVNGKPKKVKAEIRRFDFSSHSGRKELFEMFKHIKGNPKVLAIHGEEESCLKFAQEIREKFGFDTVAPTAGEKFVI